MKVIRPFLAIFFGIFFFQSVSALDDNSAPIAQDDDGYEYEGNSISGDVSLNDSDPDGDPLTYSVISGPASGTFTMNPDGTYLYVPEQEFNGFVFITYEVCDPGGLCDQGTIELAMLFLNDPPVANDDVYYMSVNTVLNANVFDNDIEIDDEPNFLNVMIPPTQGTVNMATTGAFTYTPPTDFIGTVTFTYRTCDPCEVCDQATVTIYVTTPNVPPIAENDETFTSEDGNVSGTVAANDSDPEGMPLIYSVLVGPSHGDLTFNANGTYIYTPYLNYWGWDQVIYQVCDPYNDCGQAVLDIEVLFVNDVPIAGDDFFTMNEDEILNGYLGDNDFEYDDEFVFYNVSQAPAVGTLNLFNDGYFTYTPPANYFGVVTAEYFVVDPCGTMDFATITFTILPVNDPPQAFEDEVSGDEDTIISGSVAGNDSDVESAVLSFTALTNPEEGDLVMNDDGSFTFTPNPNFFGYLLIDYQVCDEEEACTQSVLAIEVVSVNDAPVANDDNISTLEDIPASGSVAANDEDADGDELTYTLISPPGNGMLTLNSDGSFTYTPAPNDNGVYTATYEVSDGNGGIDQATLTIIITGVNDALEAINDAYTIAEDSGTFSGNLGDNDSDPDGDILSYSVVVGATSGVFNLNADGSFTYTPASNYNGIQNLSIQVCDAPTSCEITTLTITVTAVNDAPIANNDVYTINEDGSLSGNLKLNDSDVDNTNLTYSLIGNISNGMFNLNTNGTFTYTPTLNYFGTQTAQYQVCDPLGACATATLTITVNPINDAPIALNDAVTINEEQATSGSVATNDSDVDDAVLTYSIITNTSSGTFVLNSNGTYTYTPAINFYGTVSITYQVCDLAGLCDDAVLTFTIVNVNDAPVASNDSYSTYEDTQVSGTVASNDSDVDNTNLIYTVIVGPLNGQLTFNANGNFVYTPNANWNGIEEVEYQVCDAGGLCDQATLLLTVGAVNDAPVAVNNAVGILVNTVANGNVASNDYDVDSSVLTFTLLSNALNGVIVFNSDGTFTYTPDQFFVGDEVLTYQVCDDLGACDEGTLTINVISNNEPPVAVDDSYTTLEEYAFTTDLGANDVDENPAYLVFTVLVQPEHGVVVLQADGMFTYTPDFNYWGMDSFTYTVCDPFGECDEGLVSIEMQFVNDPPIIIDEEYTMDEDGILMGNVAENDIEPDDELLLYSVVTEPLHGTIELYNDGYFTYTPDPNFYGVDVVVYKACDPCQVCEQATLTIIVNSVNDAPVPMSDVFSVIEESELLGDVSLNDWDETTETLVFSLSLEPSNGSVTFNEDGTFSYLPYENYYGEDYFEYVVCDAFNECVTAAVIIQVENVNDAPAAEDDSFNMIEDDVLFGDLSENDTDVDGDELLYAIVEEPLYGVVSLNADGTFTYTPAENYYGADSFTYSACDPSGACDNAMVSIEVQFINDPPVVENESYQIMQDEMLDGEVFSNDYDLDLEVLLYSVVTDPENGIITMTNDGYFTYIPNDGWSGEDVVEYQACDPCGVCTNGFIYISVIAPNTPPVALNDFTDGCMNAQLEINLMSLISDAEESAGQLNIASAVSETGTLDIDNVSKALVYYPEENYSGVTHIDYTICDNGDPVECATAQITIDIIALTAPTLTSSTIENETCFGANDGSIEVETSGVGEITYTWSGDLVGSSNTQLAPGSYQLSLTDESQCGIASNYEFVVEGVEAPLTIDNLFENPIDEDAGGSSVYEVTGGTEPYSFQWFNANNELVSEDQILTGLNSSSDIGGYTLVVTDAHGCEVEGSIIVTDVQNIIVESGFSLYPNPARDKFYIQFNTNQYQSIELYDAMGKLVLKENVNSLQMEISIERLSSGVYHLKLLGDAELEATVKLLKN